MTSGSSTTGRNNRGWTMMLNAEKVRQDGSSLEFERALDVVAGVTEAPLFSPRWWVETQGRVGTWRDLVNPTQAQRLQGG